MDKNLELIEKVLGLLKANGEWIERYSKYITDIKKNPKTKIKRRPFNKPAGLSLYSSVSINGYRYNLRFLGESVGDVSFDKDGQNVKLLINGYNQKYDWESTTAQDFRIKFKKEFNKTDKDSLSYKLHSEEHKVESQLLDMFSKSKGSEKPFSIKPVKLYDCFFQMPTPLSASKPPITYSGKNGGGIDILARVKRGNRPYLCVIEVKDGNENNEPQSQAMKQAITYAVFIAKLLRSKSGQQWWNFFMGRFEEKYVVKDGLIPNELNIDVVTIIPKGDTEELCDKTFDVPEDSTDLKTTLHCHSLYYDKQTFEKERRFVFSGTYLEQFN